MEKQAKRKQRSASICATMCDRPVLLVLSLCDPAGERRGRTGGGSTTLSIYHRPWPGRLWNFRDSFNGVVEPQSGAETLHMAIKKKKNTKTMYCLVCSERSELSGRGHVELVYFCYYYRREEIFAGLSGMGWGRIMGIGESVVRQDQKIALCQTTELLFWFWKGNIFGTRGKKAGKSLLRTQLDFSTGRVLFAEKLKRHIFKNHFCYVKKKKKNCDTLWEYISQLRVSWFVLIIDLKC